MLSPDDFDAVTFDVYGTILQWEPEAGAFLEAAAKRGGRPTPREELLDRYDQARRPIQEHWPALRYPEVLRRTYDAVMAEIGAEPDAAERDAFGLSAAGHPPFADSVAALSALRAKGFKLGALSNIDDASFAEVTAKAGITFDVTVTGQRVGAYKPDHALFNAALADLLAMGIPPERVLHAAQSRRADIVPANALGLTCVWVNRPGHRFGRSGAGAETARPDYEVDGLAALAALLGA